MSDVPMLQLRQAPFGSRFTFPKIYLAHENQPVEERLGQVKAMKLKEDDVLICSYPKSGTHWVGNLITRLLYGVPYGRFIQVSLIDDATGTSLSNPSPRVLFSHLRPQWIPQEHLKGAGKVVLVLRNPKDVSVSYFNHIIRAGFVPPSTTWDSFFEVIMKGDLVYGTFDDYVLEWDKAIVGDENHNILVVLYEDLKTKELETLRKIQEHIGTNHSDETLKKILEECSYESLEQLAKALDTSEIAKALEDVSSGKFLLFRKGEIGDWKNWFTVAQNEAFDEMIKERLGHCTLVERIGLSLD